MVLASLFFLFFYERDPIMREKERGEGVRKGKKRVLISEEATFLAASVDLIEAGYNKYKSTKVPLLQHSTPPTST